MRCTQCRRLISQYTDGELAPPSAAELEDHLAACSGCARVAAETSALRRALRGLPPATSQTKWADVTAAVQAPRQRRAGAWAPAAACALVLLACALWYARPRPAERLALTAVAPPAPAVVQADTAATPRPSAAPASPDRAPAAAARAQESPSPRPRDPEPKVTAARRPPRHHRRARPQEQVAPQVSAPPEQQPPEEVPAEAPEAAPAGEALEQDRELVAVYQAAVVLVRTGSPRQAAGSLRNPSAGQGQDDDSETMPPEEARARYEASLTQVALMQQDVVSAAGHDRAIAMLLADQEWRQTP